MHDAKQYVQQQMIPGQMLHTLISYQDHKDGKVKVDDITRWQERMINKSKMA